MKSRAWTILRWVILPILALLSVGAGLTQEEQRPLGDVARQNKPAAKARKVITNDEIPSVQVPDTPSAPAASGESAKSAPDQAAQGKADKAKPKAELSPKDKEKQDRIEALKKDRESLLKIQKQMQDKLANETLDNRREVWSSMLQHANEQLEQNQKELDQVQKPGGDRKDQ